LIARAHDTYNRASVGGKIVDKISQELGGKTDFSPLSQTDVTGRYRHL